jgi:RraA family protein
MTKKSPASSEMHPGPGYQIRKAIPRFSSRDVVTRFGGFDTPDISDLLNRMYTMSPNIKNVVNEMPVVGPACTVKVFPGDNLMVHKALDIASPGDVIVVDASGSESTAVIGDMIASKAHHRGIAGFVIDGLVRDLPAMKNVGLPVFAKGVTPVGPLHRGPGEINYPVSCGGIVVNAGDIICADLTGVVVVREEFAEDLLHRLDAHLERTKKYVDAVRRGEFSNQWVDDALAAHDCMVKYE